MLGLIKPSLMIGGFYIAWQLGILQVMLGIAGLVILAAGNVLLYVLQLIAGWLTKQIAGIDEYKRTD